MQWFIIVSTNCVYTSAAMAVMIHSDHPEARCVWDPGRPVTVLGGAPETLSFEPRARREVRRADFKGQG